MSNYLRDEEIVEAWKERIASKAREIDPENREDWKSMWYGFVCALGRQDLANYTKYMDLGFPHEGAPL